MKIITALIKGNIHSLFKLHSYEYYREEIRLFGIVLVWCKYHWIKCADCDKIFYEKEK